MDVSSKKPEQLSYLGHALATSVAFIILYIALALLLPVNTHHLHLSNLQYRIILISVSLPGMVAWLVAFGGFGMLRQYAALIEQAPEGRYFKQLTIGAGWLAYSLPIPSLTALVLNTTASHWPGGHQSAVIISNYVGLILPLVAFSFIGQATRQMVKGSQITFKAGSARAIMTVFGIVGLTYCWLIFRQFEPISLTTSKNSYFLPVWLMVLTVVIPYLYVWFTGLLAAYEIDLYSKHLPGVLYRQALRLLAVGLITVIVGSIGLQYFSSLQVIAGNLTLDYRVLLIWLSRVISIIGFIMVTLGAYRLKKIEAV